MTTNDRLPDGDDFRVVPYTVGRVDVQIPREPPGRGVVATDRLGDIVGCE